MFARIFLGAFIGVFALWGNTAQAKVEFKQSPMALSATAGTPFDLDMRTLLNPAVVPSGTVQWKATGNPAWLKVDSATHKMTGTPANSDAGTKSFTLTVSDADSGHVGEVRMTVIIPIQPPKWASNDIDLGIQNEDKAWTFDLNTVVTNDPQGGPIGWKASGLPSWITLNQSSGILSGTPRRPDVGDYSGIVFTATNKGGSASANAHGKVLKTIHPPKWKQKQIALPDAFEDQAYMQELIGFTENFEATPLKFKIINHTPPPWLTIVESTGAISGTPKQAANVELTVELSTTIDGQVYTDVTTVKLKVNAVNDPPIWLADPINLPDAFTGIAYSQDLSKSATDPDGDKLTFKIESGPSWAKINPDTGVFSGTPDKKDVSINSWVVSVTDPSGLSARTTVKVNVIKSNEPPFWLANPTFLPDANEDKAYEQELAPHAKDPDGDQMFFTFISGPSWVQISPSGKLMGTPKKEHIGLNKIQVRVSDNISVPASVTEVRILVLHTNHPPAWILNPINLTAKEDAPFTANIAQYVKDPDDDTPLTFSAISGPPWAKLSATGTFTGTPGAKEVGPNEYVVRVMDPGGLFADVRVTITVEHVNHKPFWTQDPVVLPNGKEETPYTASLADFAKDPDGDPLRFTKVNGAPWVSVDTNGMVTGTAADPGDYTFQVRVMDPANEFAVVTVKVTIDKINHPPRWRQNPILMADAFEDTTYNFNLAIYAVDDDGDPLKFKKISGPDWMFVGDNGQVTGVPTKTHLGPFEAIFEVSDGSLTAQTKGIGTVIHKNHPPVIDPNLPVFSMKEREVASIDLKKHITDSDGDALSCVLIDTPDWLTLSQDCVATAKPLFKHIGDHSFNFKVDDKQASANGVLKVKVLRNPRPPIWLETPVKYEAKTNEKFTANLSDKVRDLDGLKVTFTKKEGKPWLTVAPDGTLSGTPTDAELGVNTFVIEVCNTDPSCATNEVIITVKPGTQIDTVNVDTAVPGAPAEHLWVVDNSSHCSSTISGLRKNIRYFFEELNKAQLHHTGMLISADAHEFDGRPITPSGGEPIMPWTASNLAADFVKRVDLAYSGGHCGNCYNSPIFSMYRLYVQAPTMSLFHNSYFMPTVPMDAMMVTHQTDHYKYYTKNNPKLKSYTASDFTRDFVDFHSKDKKAYRVSAIAPECPTLLEMSGDASSVGPSNSYRVVVDKTGGKYYATSCDFNMADTLKDFAKKIIFRAYVHAKDRIKLSKTPISINTIKVMLGSTVLTENTQWNYDAATNEVILYWNAIDDSKLKPGDKIQIEYRVS